MEPRSPCSYQAVSSKYLTTMLRYWQIQQSTPRRSTRLVPRKHAVGLKSDWRRLNRKPSAPSYKLRLNAPLLAFELQNWLADEVVVELRCHVRSNKCSPGWINPMNKNRGGEVRFSSSIFIHWIRNFRYCRHRSPLLLRQNLRLRHRQNRYRLPSCRPGLLV